MKDFIEVRACSAVVLQVCANVALVCGLFASWRQEFRHCSILALYCARATSGTLFETHASYFAMKSSHSATPMVVALVVVVAGEVVAAGLVATRLVPASLVGGSDL
ncbi:MAG: hypothetical protein ACRD8U_02680 [Pyrinomonadaceae bacterium]